MMLMYDPVNVTGHVAYGLLEKHELTDQQEVEIKQINFLIEALRKDISALYNKIGVFSADQAIKKAEKDKEVDKEIREWMKNVFATQTNFINKMVDEFNRKNAKNYDNLIPKGD